MAGIMCITALTGCGKVSSEADSSEKTFAKKIFSKEISLAEAFSPKSEYKIWYKADIKGGDGSGDIYTVYYFDGDTFKVYDASGDISVKDIKDMTDGEIIKLMEEKYVFNVWGRSNEKYIAELEQNLSKYRNALDEILSIETPSEDWSCGKTDKNGNEFPTVSELKQVVKPLLDAVDNFDIEQYKKDIKLKYTYEIEIHSENNSTLTDELEDVVTSECITALTNDYDYNEGKLIGTLEWICQISDEYNEDMSYAENETDMEDARWDLFHDIYKGLYEADVRSDVEQKLKSDAAFVTVESSEWEGHTVVDYPLSEGIKIGDTYFGGYHGYGSSDLVCRCKEGTVFTMDKPDAPGTVKPEEYHASEETSTEE